MPCPFTGRRRAASSLALIDARCPWLPLTLLFDSAVPRPLVSHIQQLVSPFDDLAQVERFLEDGTGIMLEPGAHVLRFGVTTHDGDLPRERRMAVNQGQVERQP